MKMWQITENEPRAAKTAANLYALRGDWCIEHANSSSGELHSNSTRGLRKHFGAKEAV
jgi:hypothetical protein